MQNYHQLRLLSVSALLLDLHRRDLMIPISGTPPVSVALQANHRKIREAPVHGQAFAAVFRVLKDHGYSAAKQADRRDVSAPAGLPCDIGNILSPVPAFRITLIVRAGINADTLLWLLWLLWLL
jgi:hypothetical protein